jgi:uncharacterized protein YjbJ (UPF0337 family)
VALTVAEREKFAVDSDGVALRRFPLIKESVMGLDDKAKNKAEELKGKGKETVGRATDDEELEAEGRTDQATSNLKQAGEKIKDVFK